MDCSNLKLRESSDSNIPIWILPAALALSYSTELQCVPYSMEILATSLFNLSICVSNMFNVRAASGNLNAVVFDHRSDVSNAYVLRDNPLLRQWHVKRAWRIHYGRLRNFIWELSFIRLLTVIKVETSVCRGSATLSDMEYKWLS